MEEKKYRIVNRGQTDRTLIIEHPNRTNQQFKLVETAKPIEETSDVLRFQNTLKAGESSSFVVKEERNFDTSSSLSNNPDSLIRYFIELKEISPSLKEKLTAAMRMKGKWDDSQRELNQVAAELKTLNADQDRIRKNLRETPKEAEVYTTYLKKLSDQEKEIDKLTERQKKLMTEEFSARKSFEDYLANLTD
jgi:chromosome segregation ATPase